MRNGEHDGADYRFIGAAQFDDMAARGQLLEHALVFGNRYGTPAAPVEEALAAGRDVLFDIDWQGTQQLREKSRNDLASIFILPPTVAELERRLRVRKQDSDETVRSRMAKAADEMSHWAEYDYVLVNRDVNESVAEVRAIMRAERLRRERQTGIDAFVRTLRGG
jgi:guanylate kinase